MRRIGSILIVCVALSAWSGCQQPIQPDGPTDTQLTGADFEQLWQTGLEVLRRYNFRPDRQDRRAGVITTHPTTSAQWFEFWRPGVVGGFEAGEASLHTVRRQATVHIRPAAEQGQLYVSVQVDVYRYAAPERQVTTASGALQIFGEKLPTAEGRMEPLAEASYWVPLGRDGRLEDELLRRIAWQVGTDIVEPLASLEPGPPMVDTQATSIPAE